MMNKIVFQVIFHYDHAFVYSYSIRTQVELKNRRNDQVSIYNLTRLKTIEQCYCPTSMNRNDNSFFHRPSYLTYLRLYFLTFCQCSCDYTSENNQAEKKVFQSFCNLARKENRKSKKESRISRFKVTAAVIFLPPGSYQDSQMNSTFTPYPFYAYDPSRIAASILASIAYASLLIWLGRCIWNAFRPRTLTIMILVSHLFFFLLIFLRIPISINDRNTRFFFKLEGTFATTSFQLFVASHYQCLLEMANNKKMSIKDIIMAIALPIGLISAGVTMGVGQTKALDPEQHPASFRLRQISASIMIFYILLFYVMWFTTEVRFRRRFIVPMLSISSVCLLIHGIYLLLSAIPSYFLLMANQEVWLYLGHFIPISMGLLSWSILFWFKPIAMSEVSKENQQETQLMANSESV